MRGRSLASHVRLHRVETGVCGRDVAFGRGDPAGEVVQIGDRRPTVDIGLGRGQSGGQTRDRRPLVGHLRLEARDFRGLGVGAVDGRFQFVQIGDPSEGLAARAVDDLLQTRDAGDDLGVVARGILDKLQHRPTKAGSVVLADDRPHAIQTGDGVRHRPGRGVQKFVQIGDLTFEFGDSVPNGLQTFGQSAIGQTLEFSQTFQIAKDRRDVDDGVGRPVDPAVLDAADPLTAGRDRAEDDARRLDAEDRAVADRDFVVGFRKDVRQFGASDGLVTLGRTDPAHFGALFGRRDRDVFAEDQRTAPFENNLSGCRIVVRTFHDQRGHDDRVGHPRFDLFFGRLDLDGVG